jgi:hypothetical protein
VTPVLWYEGGGEVKLAGHGREQESSAMFFRELPELWSGGFTPRERNASNVHTPLPVFVRRSSAWGASIHVWVPS